MSAPSAGATSALTAKDAVSERERIIFGGLGGLAPILLNLAVVDPTKVFVDFTFAVAAGYGLRLIGLCSLGAIVAWAHKQERDTLRLFELGIIAPALVTTLINGTAAKRADSVGRDEPRTTAPLIGTILGPGVAYAQSPRTARAVDSVVVYSFGRRPETTLQQFWRGLTGITSQDRWFVVLDAPVGSRGRGEVILRDLRQKGLEARLYGAGGPTTAPLVIVLNDWVDEQTARRHSRLLQTRHRIKVFPWYLPQ